MSTATRPFARSGLLIAMLAGAATGLVAARAIESAVGGADPEFVGVLGAAFGGVLGRLLWTRVHRARASRRSAATPILLLLARVTLCLVAAYALFGPASVATLPLTARMTAAALALLMFSLLGVVEYRWLRQEAGHVD